MNSRKILRPLLKAGTVAGLSVAGVFAVYKGYSMYSLYNHEKFLANSPLYHQYAEENPHIENIPSREEQFERLDKEEYDVLIIGGGATGAGCVVDATTRGLKCALLERDDFACGTSSRSTKLVHGGVRYLEKALMQLDYGQYELVTEALAERKSFLDIAPHLSSPLPIMLPVYEWWQVPYFWIGCKFYDFFAGEKGLSSSYYLSKSKALEVFPMLKPDSLKAALVYYDGQQNDSRMNVSLVMTAAAFGATVVNHCEVKDLIKKEGKVVGAVVQDTLSGTTRTVKAKLVINATGPFTDAIRKMDDQLVEPIVVPSAGVHIVLPEYFAPTSMGLIEPNTSDGRVIFFLPWQGRTIAGTTDAKSDLTYDPYPSETDIGFIIRELNRQLSDKVTLQRSDVSAAWSGLRPLVKDPSQSGTENLSRSHVIEVSKSGLISISGGKWTTYRRMAQDTIDKAIEVASLKAKGPCITEKVKLLGAHNYSDLLHISLAQKYGLDNVVSNHLAHTYGDLSDHIAVAAEPTGLRSPVRGNRLHQNFPYIEAEIPFTIHKEYARTLIDVIARRTRLSFLDAHACLDALPRIADLMARELGWSESTKKHEILKAKKFLLTMGLEDSLAPFNSVELSEYRTLFSTLDKDGDGMINWGDFRGSLPRLNMTDSASSIQEVLNGELIDFGMFIDIIHNHQVNSGFSKEKYLSRDRISNL